MLIEDKELRDLYQAASQEHLGSLEVGILKLEQGPVGAEDLKKLLRAAHSLKGDSRMLGVSDAETLTHQLESLLQDIPAGESASSELCERLWLGFDAIRQIADSAVTGKPCEVNVFGSLALMMGGGEAPEPETLPAPEMLPTIAASVAVASHAEAGSTAGVFAQPEPDLPEPALSIPSSPQPNSPQKSYWIEDDELRSLYETASREHLEQLEAGCLHLENHPDDRSMMKDLLREAHSLKGDSRMLGVQDAETLTHQLETLLQEVDRGTRAVDQALCDRLYLGLDAIRHIAHSASTGELCEAPVFEVMAQLMGAEVMTEARTEARTEVVAVRPIAVQPVERSLAPVAALQEVPPSLLLSPPVSPAANPEIGPNINPSVNPEAAPDRGPDSQIQSVIMKPVRDRASIVPPPAETIRVASAKLDTLVTQVSELSVTQRRISDWSSSVTDLLDLWEGWMRDAFVQQLALGRAQHRLSPDIVEMLQSVHKQNEQRLEQLGGYVKQFREQTSTDGARLDSISGDLEAGIRNLRMLPLSNVFNLYRRMVRDLSMEQGKIVNFIIEGGDTQVDKRILEEIKDPLSHLVRNAIDHGIETSDIRTAAGKPSQATLRLRGYRRGSSVIIELTDDGQGLDIEKIKQTALRRSICTEAALDRMSLAQIQFLIFAPGFSTRTEVSEISGRGIGLDVVRTNIERLKGSIGVRAKAGKGCQFRLTLNPGFATTEVLILKLNGTSYAMPIESVDRMVNIDRSDLFAIKGNLTATLDGEPLSVAWLSDLLGLSASTPKSAHEAEVIAQKIPCIVVKTGSKRLGLFVDALVDQQEIILKTQSKLLQRIRNISGSTILGNGEVCLILNPQDLFKTLMKQNGAVQTFEKLTTAANYRPRILLVEDSIPIRTQIKRILENSGYEVIATVDGLDGYSKLRAEEIPFAAVVSDVEMPQMTGLELTAQIRQHAEYDALPIVLVTTLAKAEDQKRGRDAGANAYITKGNFDQNLLIETLRGLIQS